jgi:hypothetical protein
MGEVEKLRKLLEEAQYACESLEFEPCSANLKHARNLKAQIDAALAEPVVDPVQAWKDANGYNDLLAAYSSTITERDEARAEVAAAYQRGAEAMREAAAKAIEAKVSNPYVNRRMAEEVRALPLPEDKL